MQAADQQLARQQRRPRHGDMSTTSMHKQETTRPVGGTAAGQPARTSFRTVAQAASPPRPMSTAQTTIAVENPLVKASGEA